MDHRQRWLQAGGSLHRFDAITDFDFYKNIPGWFDFDDIYDEAVAGAADGATFVEIGSHYGRSTAYLASRVALARKKINIAAVDPWLAYIGNEAVSSFPGFLNCMLQAGVLDLILPLRTLSVHAAKFFDAHSIDFCFIDGDHSYEAVSEDLRLWYPKVRPGCIIAGHDYIYTNEGERGVSIAVDEFFGKAVTVRRRSWFHRKP